MKNLKFGVHKVNGDYHPFEFTSGRELIVELLTDDWGAPPRGLVIEAMTKEGQSVRISIPYDEDSPASAFVD